MSTNNVALAKLDQARAAGATPHIAGNDSAGVDDLWQSLSGEATANSPPIADLRPERNAFTIGTAAYAREEDTSTHRCVQVFFVTDRAELVQQRGVSV